MSRQKLLIFNGSPRKKGTSYSFGRTLKNLAEESGNTAEIVHIIDYVEEKKDFGDLKKQISESDIIALVCPLYVDSLPYPVICFFEKLENQYNEILIGKKFFAISQCAFPYVRLLQPALGSCRCFAEAVGMRWLGGLGYGGGVILDGAYLENLGKKGEKLTYAFKLVLEDVVQGKNISSKPQELIDIKMPKLLSRPMAAFLNYRSRKLGRKNGVKDLRKKAYLE